MLYFCYSGGVPAEAEFKPDKEVQKKSKSSGRVEAFLCGI
jgi:hypothetical protein